MFAGHADIGTTANIYAHLDTSDLATALKVSREPDGAHTGAVLAYQLKKKDPSVGTTR